MENYAWSFEVACGVMVRVHVRVRVRARVGKWVLNYRLFFYSALNSDGHICLVLLA